MAIKADFTPEAWELVRTAPLSVATLVMTASFGLGDMLKEGRALAKMVCELAQQADESPLLMALAAEYQQKDTSLETTLVNTSDKVDPAVRKAQLLDDLRSAVTAVDATTSPQESDDFRRWLYSTGEAVANAAKEGGFLGIGGKLVGPAEEAVLVEIKAVLGL